MISGSVRTGGQFTRSTGQIPTKQTKNENSDRFR
jgi:hypothetical protein